jgi:hypothetical protein
MGYILQLHCQLESVLVHPQQLTISLLTNVKIITTVYPLINGLSDHDGQIIIIYNDKCNMSQKQIHAQRVIDEFSLLDFQINLSYELWDEIFTYNDVDIIFNNFLNTYLRIVNSWF